MRHRILFLTFLVMAFHLDTPTQGRESEPIGPPYKGKKFCLTEGRIENTLDGDRVVTTYACDGGEPADFSTKKTEKPEQIRGELLKDTTALGKQLLDDGYKLINCLSPSQGAGVRYYTKYICTYVRS